MRTAPQPLTRATGLLLALGLATPIAAQAFVDTFENGFGQWTSGLGTGFSGQIVPDPIEADHALSFSQINHSGDTWTVAVFPAGTYMLFFDYLGWAQPGSTPGNHGGVIGAHVVGQPPGGFMLGTVSDPSIPSDVLIDDGVWRRYMINFTRSAPFRLVIEDWSGSYGVPGDSLFDNIILLPGATDGNIVFGMESLGCPTAPNIQVTSTPHTGNAAFSVQCFSAPVSTSGLLVAAPMAVDTPTIVIDAEFWLSMSSPWLVTRFVTSDAMGFCSVTQPIPPAPQLSGVRFYEQFLWMGSSPSCPAAVVSSSAGIEITVL